MKHLETASLNTVKQSVYRNRKIYYGVKYSYSTSLKYIR